MTEPFWMKTARKYLGQKEIHGVQNNPVIVQWWIRIGAPFRDDETPYCAGFVGGVLEETGIRSSRSAMARSYLTWGEKLAGPAVGCIVVFERGPKNGHVAFVVGHDGKGNLICLGGNQGDMVKLAKFPLWRVLGYRWPAGYPQPLHLGVNTLPVVEVSGLVSKNEA